MTDYISALPVVPVHRLKVTLRMFVSNSIIYRPYVSIFIFVQIMFHLDIMVYIKSGILLCSPIDAITFVFVHNLCPENLIFVGIYRVSLINDPFSTSSQGR